MLQIGLETQVAIICVELTQRSFAAHHRNTHEEKLLDEDEDASAATRKN